MDKEQNFLINNDADTHSGEGLSPDRFADFFAQLDEDTLRALLERSGIDPSEPAPETADAAAPDPDICSEEAEEDTAAAPGDGSSRKKKKAGKTKLLKIILVFLIAVSILAVPLAVHTIYMSATLNSEDPIQYSEHKDDISAAEGTLIVNNVSVSVPTDGTEKYSISYAWAEEDTEYPSVPHAITAVYTDSGGSGTYSVSLYRNESFSGKKIPKGKSAENWFDDWQTSSDDKVVQELLKSGDISGFYIHPAVTDSSGSMPDYNNYCYYFAVKEDSNLNIYVLEGELLSPEAAVDLSSIMSECINSITIKEPADEPAPAES